MSDLDKITIKALQNKIDCADIARDEALALCELYKREKDILVTITDNALEVWEKHKEPLEKYGCDCVGCVMASKLNGD